MDNQSIINNAYDVIYKDIIRQRRFSFSVPTSPPLNGSIGADPPLLNLDKVTHNLDVKAMYKKPPHESFDARRIWRQAMISDIATVQEIVTKLESWAILNASIERDNNRIEFISWKSSGNSICKSTWTAFLKWILCASTKM